MTAPIHIIVYTKRQLGNGRGAPKKLVGHSAASLQRPVGHGFGQAWLYHLFSADQPVVIWLFSVLRYRDLCLPPALDARIEVTHAFTRANKKAAPPDTRWLLGKPRFPYAFQASLDSSRSYYLPWNHFGPTLTQVIEGVPTPAVEPEVDAFSVYARLLQQFQTPRHVAPGKVAILEAYATAVRAMPPGFVSYRRRDAPMLAMQAAARLSHHGVAPWWDQWAMPRKIAEEMALCSKRALKTALTSSVDRAQYAITVHTATYGQSPATKLELARIRRASQHKESFVHLPWNPTARATDSPASAKAEIDALLKATGAAGQ